MNFFPFYSDLVTMSPFCGMLCHFSQPLVPYWPWTQAKIIINRPKCAISKSLQQFIIQFIINTYIRSTSENILITLSKTKCFMQSFIYEQSAVLYNNTHLSLFETIFNDHSKYRQILCLQKQFPFAII